MGMNKTDYFMFGIRLDNDEQRRRALEIKSEAEEDLDSICESLIHGNYGNSIQLVMDWYDDALPMIFGIVLEDCDENNSFTCQKGLFQKAMDSVPLINKAFQEFFGNELTINDLDFYVTSRWS